MSVRAIKLRRRFIEKEVREETTITGETFLSFSSPAEMRLNSLELTVTENLNDTTDKKLTIRGKNLFNPAREFQSGTAYLGSKENLQAGIDAGQMLFYGITHTGSVMRYSVSNQYQIVISISEGVTYSYFGYIKSKALLLDENFNLIKYVNDTVFTNDVNAKYLMYYTYNHAQATNVQGWTLDDVKNKTQIETGDVATEYEPYAKPIVSVIPSLSNGETGTELLFSVGDTLKIDFRKRQVLYNQTDITADDFGQYLLGITCVAKTTVIETEGFNCNITAKYYA